MTNEKFIQVIKENQIEILKDIIYDKQKETKKLQITIGILILLFFAISIFHFWNNMNFIKSHFMSIQVQKAIVNE